MTNRNTNTRTAAAHTAARNVAFAATAYRYGNLAAMLASTDAALESIRTARKGD